MFITRNTGSILDSLLTDFSKIEKETKAVSKELPESYELQVSLPGHSNKTVECKAEGFELTVIAKIPESSSSLVKNYTGTFKLPEDAYQFDITAKMVNGILEVSIPKKKKSAKLSKITVQ